MPSNWSEEDKARLAPRNVKVLEALQGGDWMTLEAIGKIVGMQNWGTIASRIRDIASRSDNVQSDRPWVYEMRRTDRKGVWEYRLIYRDYPEVLKQAELPFLEAL